MIPESSLIAADIEAYLAQHERKELVRLLTCGSVDDGKSTLIGRLLFDSQMIYEDQLAAVRRDSERRGFAAGELDLALLTDGLRAEREQGITIDVAYRYFSTSRRKFIIADTPGHEQYTRNMATGASTCDLAVILIDARNGVARQTKRHSFIASLLGIKHIVVAVNKMDLVEYDEEVFRAIQEDYSAFAAKLELNDLRFIPISALRGDNVVQPSGEMPWYRGETLLHYLDSVHIASDRNLIDFRFPVQYVQRPHLDFRGFGGTIASGVVRRGDSVTAVPSGLRSRVKSIVTADGELEEAFAPMAVTLTLEDEVDVSRGDMLVPSNNLPTVERRFEAMVVWMADAPLVPGRQYWIKQATSLVSVSVSALRYRIDVNTLHRQDATALQINEVGRCQITASRPIAFDSYRKNRATGAFILIDRLTNGTVGAGVIVDRATSSRLLEDFWDDDAAAGVERERVHVSQVSLAERQGRFEQQAVTVLLTGLSASGKSSIAYALERRLFDLGHAVAVLDGGRMRRTISRDLGFTAAERSENLRRSTDVARFMNDAGLICICAFMAPSEAARRKARAAIGDDRFIEVYLSAPAEVCRTRDTEGMYAKADSGEIPDFPGVTAAYEAPSAPALVLPTHEWSVERCVDAMVELLKARGVLRGAA